MIDEVVSGFKRKRDVADHFHLFLCPSLSPYRFCQIEPKRKEKRVPCRVESCSIFHAVFCTGPKFDSHKLMKFSRTLAVFSDETRCRGKASGTQKNSVSFPYACTKAAKNLRVQPERAIYTNNLSNIASHIRDKHLLTEGKRAVDSRGHRCM